MDNKERRYLGPGRRFQCISRLVVTIPKFVLFRSFRNDLWLLLSETFMWIDIRNVLNIYRSHPSWTSDSKWNKNCNDPTSCIRSGPRWYCLNSTYGPKRPSCYELCTRIRSPTNLGAGIYSLVCKKFIVIMNINGMKLNNTHLGMIIIIKYVVMFIFYSLLTCLRLTRPVNGCCTSQNGHKETWIYPISELLQRWQ